MLRTLFQVDLSRYIYECVLSPRKVCCLLLLLKFLVSSIVPISISRLQVIKLPAMCVTCHENHTHCRRKPKHTYTRITKCILALDSGTPCEERPLAQVGQVVYAKIPCPTCNNIDYIFNTEPLETPEPRDELPPSDPITVISPRQEPEETDISEEEIPVPTSSTGF